MSKLTQQITDICFEEGTVTKPMVDRLEQLFKTTMLELVGDDIKAIDLSDQSIWGEDYKHDHDCQVEYHNSMLRRLRRKVEQS